MRQGRVVGSRKEGVGRSCQKVFLHAVKGWGCVGWLPGNAMPCQETLLGNAARCVSAAMAQQRATARHAEHACTRQWGWAGWG